MAIIDDIDVALWSAEPKWTDAGKIVKSRRTDSFIQAGEHLAHVDDLLAVNAGVPGNAAAGIGIDSVLAVQSAVGVTGRAGTLVYVCLAAIAGEPRGTVTVERPFKILEKRGTD